MTTPLRLIMTCYDTVTTSLHYPRLFTTALRLLRYHLPITYKGGCILSRKILIYILGQSLTRSSWNIAGSIQTKFMDAGTSSSLISLMSYSLSLCLSVPLSIYLCLLCLYIAWDKCLDDPVTQTYTSRNDINSRCNTQQYSTWNNTNLCSHENVLQCFVGR